MPRKSNVETAGGVLLWDRVRGRCNVDDPAVLPTDMAAEAWNWVISTRGLGQKRYGCGKQVFTGATSYEVIYSMARFVPGQDEGAAELHLLVTVSGLSNYRRIAGGTAATAITLPDGGWYASDPRSWTTGNGKLFWAWNNATDVNRLHVYDPAYGGLRRCGLQSPLVPNANSITGGPAAPLGRTYRIQSRYFVGGKQLS